MAVQIRNFGMNQRAIDSCSDFRSKARLYHHDTWLPTRKKQTMAKMKDFSIARLCTEEV